MVLYLLPSKPPGIRGEATEASAVIRLTDRHHPAATATRSDPFSIQEPIQYEVSVSRFVLKRTIYCEGRPLLEMGKTVAKQPLTGSHLNRLEYQPLRRGKRAVSPAMCITGRSIGLALQVRGWFGQCSLGRHRTF